MDSPLRDMDKKKKKIVHRHKWCQNYADCPDCGSFEYYDCECGEIGERTKSGRIKIRNR